MDKKIKWLLYLGSIFITASACNLFSIGIDNVVDDVISEIEDLSEQIPVEEIIDEIESAATDLQIDIDNIEEEIDALVTEIPFDLDDFGDIGNLGDFDSIRDLIEDGLISGSGEAPEDIPIVEDPKEILIESEELVSYLTPQDFSFIKAFYMEQMPLNGWSAVQDNIINDNSALLFYEKGDQEATITINFNPSDGKTSVMIFVQ